MTNLIIIIFFFAISIVEICAEYFYLSWLVFSTKPLLMPVLMIYVFHNIGLREKRSKTQLLLALLFSMLGDVILMFSSKDEMFFLVGLTMFLITHLFYILLFISYKKPILLWSHTIILLIFILSYYYLLMYTINPNLLDFSIPVYIYGIVLCVMLFTSFILDFKQQKAVVAIGAMLFVFSDSLIALNKFYFVESSMFIQPSIMLLYVLGQFCIVFGTTKYLRKSRI